MEPINREDLPEAERDRLDRMETLLLAVCDSVHQGAIEPTDLTALVAALVDGLAQMSGMCWSEALLSVAHQRQAVIAMIEADADEVDES